MTTTPAKRENLLLNLVFNIVVPSLVLSKLSTVDRLGPGLALVVALAFPVTYGVWDFVQRRQANFVSIIGFVSILLTGGLGLFKVGGFWFAVKEAAVPGVIGLAVLFSMRTKRPLIRQMLYNDQVIDVSRVNAALDERGQRVAFDRLLNNSSYWLVASFLISSVLNFVLARYLLKSPPGTPEFNAELGRMNLWSWPVIVVPSTAMMMFALWRLIGGIKALTGLELEQLMRGLEETKPSTSS